MKTRKEKKPISCFPFFVFSWLKAFPTLNWSGSQGDSQPGRNIKKPEPQQWEATFTRIQEMPIRASPLLIRLRKYGHYKISHLAG
jgi:hypothetical protein